MTINLPDVVAARPNIDASRAARIDTSGLLMTRDAAQRLNASIAARATLRAVESAAKRAHLDSARASAREAMQALVAAPLRAAGLGDVTVVVRYPWEADGTGTLVRWDESRTPTEVLGR